MVKLAHDIKDDDLEKILSTVNGITVTMERFRQTLDRFAEICPTIKITVLGFTLATVEVKLNELKEISG